MTIRRALFLLPGVLAISACEPKPPEVEFGGNAENVAISAFRIGLLPVLRSPTSIASVSVWPKDSEEFVWQIRSSGQCRANLHQVQYGVVPEGFEQLAAPKSLSEDIVYAVRIEDCDGLQGGGYFDITDGRVGTIAFVTIERR